MTSKYFNPHKSFISLPALWGVVVALSLFSLVLASIIVANSELDVDLSFNGFNNFFDGVPSPLRSTSFDYSYRRIAGGKPSIRAN